MSSHQTCTKDRLLAHAEDLLAHPRLFLARNDFERVQENIDADRLLGEYADRLSAETELLLETEPMERRQIGRRLLGVSRTCLGRVLRLSYAYRLTGRPEFADRAEQEMLSAAAFADWNPSHFLDVAEMTAALAIGYDWLHECLARSSRDTIRRAIVDKGLEPSLEADGWARATHNWNPVCNGSLTIGALAVLEEETELAAHIIQRALETVPLAMEAYGPNGAYPEGPGYWRYGTVFNVLMIDALESALGTDYGLSDHVPFMASANYYLHAHGATGQYFNYSDCGRKSGLAPAMFWFARRLDRPELLWMERRKLENLLNRSPKEGEGGIKTGGRLMPMALAWSPPLEDVYEPQEKHYHDTGRNPVAMHRTGWLADDTYVGLKASSPAENHGHMDVGTFVLETGGVRWAIELGAESYHALESAGINLWDGSQEGDRWDIFRYGNHGHNTLVINGEKQRVDGRAPIAEFDPENRRSVIDMTPVYAGRCASVRRSVELDDGGTVSVEDRLQAPDRDVSVRWAFLTRAEVKLDGSVATLLQQGKHIAATVVSPEELDWQVLPTNPSTRHESQNEGTRMLAFHVHIPAGEERQLRVEFQG